MGKIKVTQCGDIEGLKVIEQLYLVIPEDISWKHTIITISRKQALMWK